MTEPVVHILDPAEAGKYAADAASLYRAPGWIGEKDPDSSMIPLLQNAYRVMGAFADGHLIGMMRALSDGVSDAYLLDMVVAEPYRNRGIAHRILSELTESLRRQGIDWIVCISVPEAESLYAKSGTVMKGHVPFRFFKE